jgi:Zinc knuckle
MSYNFYGNVYNAQNFQNVCKICDDYGHISSECPINAPYFQNVCEICGEFGHLTSECPINYPVQDLKCESSNSELDYLNFYRNHYDTPSYPSYGWENEPYNFSSNLTPPNNFCHYPTYGDSTEQELENTLYKFIQSQMECNAQMTQVSQQLSEISDQLNTLTNAIIPMDEEQHLEHSQCIEDDHPIEMHSDVESPTTLDCEKFNKDTISHEANEPKVILSSLSGVEIHISQFGEGIEMELSVEILKEKLNTPLLGLHKLAYTSIWLRFLNPYPCYVWIDWIKRAFIQQKNFKIKKIHGQRVISELKPD